MNNICFEEMFDKTKGKPIRYKGKLLFLADYLTVHNNDKYVLTIESFKSDWKQGVALKACEGSIVIDNREFPKGVVLWQDCSILKIEFAIKAKKNKPVKLEIKNVWDTGNGLMESWHNGAAMTKEELPDGSIRYWCNDGYPDDDLNDIVFRVEKIKTTGECKSKQKGVSQYTCSK